MKRPSITSLAKSEKGVLLLLWCCLTLFNINKAFHIDDTFHLIAAEHIAKDPLRPMSGIVNWEHDPSKLYEHNQPPLFFYLIAGWSAIFGKSEIALHLLLSIFTFLGLYYFQKITFQLDVKHRHWLLIVFAFCPAFIINQNLMIDVPIMAITLSILHHLLLAKKHQGFKHYFIASLLLSAGLLMKYSLLPLLPIFGVVAAANRHFKQLTTLLIPITTLLLWSLWNQWEFGSTHLFDRPVGTETPGILLAFVVCLGAISTYAMVFLSAAVRKKWFDWVLQGSLAAFLVSVIAFYFGDFDQDQYAFFLNILFALLGTLTLLALLYLSTRDIVPSLPQYLSSNAFIVLLFLGGFSAFILLFAPFIATRHLLLVIPFILLLGHRATEWVTPKIRKTTLATSVLLGTILGISDWCYADYFREMAKRKYTEETTTLWSVGHWGWQWYTQQNGYKTYASNEVKVKKGDFIIYPKNISAQQTHEKHQTEVVKKVWNAPSIFTFFSGNDRARMYHSADNEPPWRLSKRPIDTIMVERVVTGIDIGTLINRIKNDVKWMELIQQKAEERSISIDSMLTKEALWLLEH